jgi:hypothetical protein
LDIDCSFTGWGCPLAAEQIDGKMTSKYTILQDRRVADTSQYTTSYTQTTREMIATSKDSLNALGMLQKSVDAMAQAIPVTLMTLLNKKMI